MAHQLFPSILSADFSNLQLICEQINTSDADGFHLDVMDGVFVPNISFGFPIIKAIRKYAVKPLDVHLMIINPDKFIEKFKDAGADTLTIHYETCVHLHKTVNTIKNNGMKVCVALNPHTAVWLLNDIIKDIDSVCLMSVNPGFGGQTFIENTYSKVKQLRELIISKDSKALIKVDGGVDLQNYHQLVSEGANILVAGTSVFGTASPLRSIQKLKSY